MTWGLTYFDQFTCSKFSKILNNIFPGKFGLNSPAGNCDILLVTLMQMPMPTEFALKKCPLPFGGGHNDRLKTVVKNNNLYCMLIRYLLNHTSLN